jgi:predicted tellurium resistance membrane protein TerC
MIFTKSILTGIYVGIDHGIWISLLLRKVPYPMRETILLPISVWVTILQILSCFFIHHVQDNAYVKFFSAIILIFTAMQLFQEIPDLRSRRGREVARIVILILSGSVDNLITIEASSSEQPAWMVVSASLSFPIILFTVRYLARLVVGRLWFYLYGILLMVFSASQLLLDAFGVKSLLAEILLISCIYGMILILGPLWAALRSR